MAQIKTWKCDGCGAVKQKASHWYTLDTTSKTMVIAKWDEQLAESVEFHLCGVGCLGGKVTKVTADWAASEAAFVRRTITDMERAVAQCTTK